jgi:hypothetical protein
VSSGGATNPSRATNAPGTDLNWDYLSKITQAEYDARRAEIAQWIMTHPRPR